MKNDRKISLAITTYNRFEMTIESFSKVIDDDRISDIVIVDDCSKDGSWNKLRDWYPKGESMIRLYSNGSVFTRPSSPIMPKGESMIRLFSNDVNLDCYKNKRQAVGHAKNPWVVLLDSDNIIDSSYLDAIYSLQHWNPTTVYCPEFARPHFDYREFSGMTFDRSNVARFMDNGKFQCCLNTANYCVNREEYLKVWDGSVNPHTSDSIFQMYNWFAGGNKMHVVPGMQYYHRVHSGSHFKLNHKKTGDFGRRVVEKLKGLR